MLIALIIILSGIPLLVYLSPEQSRLSAPRHVRAGAAEADSGDLVPVQPAEPELRTFEQARRGEARRHG